MFLVQYHFTKMQAPLAGMSTVQGLDSYPFPRPASPTQLSDLRTQVEQYHRQNLFVIGFAVQILSHPGICGAWNDFLKI